MRCTNTFSRIHLWSDSVVFCTNHKRWVVHNLMHMVRCGCVLVIHKLSVCTPFTRILAKDHAPLNEDVGRYCGNEHLCAPNRRVPLVPFFSTISISNISSKVSSTNACIVMAFGCAACSYRCSHLGFSDPFRPSAESCAPPTKMLDGRTNIRGRIGKYFSKELYAPQTKILEGRTKRR